MSAPGKPDPEQRRSWFGRLPTWGKVGVVVGALVVFGAILQVVGSGADDDPSSGTGDETAGPIAPTYEIKAERDFSHATAVRYSFRIVSEEDLTESEMLSIAKELTEKKVAETDVNALNFFFYKPGTDWESSYTKGSVDWAPYGDWGRASEVDTGDYSTHEFSVEGFYE